MLNEAAETLGYDLLNGLYNCFCNTNLPKQTRITSKNKLYKNTRNCTNKSEYNKIVLN